MNYFPTSKNIEAFNIIYTFYKKYKKDLKDEDLRSFAIRCNFILNYNFILEDCKGYPFDLFLSIFDEYDKKQIIEIVKYLECMKKELDWIHIKYKNRYYKPENVYYLRFGVRWKMF
jgi:hypothetical protein